MRRQSFYRLQAATPCALGAAVSVGSFWPYIYLLRSGISAHWPFACQQGGIVLVDLAQSLDQAANGGSLTVIVMHHQVLLFRQLLDDRAGTAQ